MLRVILAIAIALKDAKIDDAEKEHILRLILELITKDKK
jgi:hypothetical protein